MIYVRRSHTVRTGVGMVVEEVKLSAREKYRVKDVIADLKKIAPTPSITYKIGSQLIYYEYNICQQTLGAEDNVTSCLAKLLHFMQHDYERQLIEGELYKTSDTPRAALNRVAKEMTPETLKHVINRPADYIHGLLESAYETRRKEIARFKALEKAAQLEVKENPENSDAWNKLRLLLWIIGRYKEASQAFQKAKRLGWDPATSPIVGL